MNNAAAGDTARIRILLVEDTEADAELVLASLRSAKLEVEHTRVWSRSGLSDALGHGPWDAVLCDHSMPQFDGLSALYMVRAHDADLPFIIVSGAIGEETAVAAMRNGAQDFVMKQNLRRLGAVLVREMEEARMRRAARIASRNLQAKEALLDSIVNTAADGIVVVTIGGIIEFANPALCRMLGCDPSELDGVPIEDLLQSNTQTAAFWESLFCSSESEQTAPLSLQTHARSRDGTMIPVEIHAGRMLLNGSRRATVVVRDISERLDSQEQMWRLAHFDELSGLPNRLLFRQLLEQALIDAGRSKKPLAVLLIDLDRFKLINDTLGHDTGDEVLRQVTARLRQCLSETDIISRFGGDEFAALIRDIDDADAARAAAKRVLAAVDQPYRLNGEEYHLSASIGISTFPGDSVDATALLRNAELAMYRAKDQGKNNFQFHSPQMNARSFEYVVLERFLRRAIEQDEFLIHYQPQVEVASGRLTGAEALLRWNHPGMGMMQPDKFIPLAEETGLIVPIGRIVMMRACVAAKRWQECGIPGFRVAVNLSPRQFAQSELVADVRHILEDTGLAPEFLELEITESMVMENPERAAAILHELRAVGVKLAIDDFGTGYSSLGYLKRFPVDTLKIDRSFIKDVPADADDVAITHAVIAMGHSLRLLTVAEGVETKAQAEFLATNGCDLMQGYLISRPLPMDEMDRFLAQRCGLVIPQSQPTRA
ncbi:MAG: EAL domain-containing protein [Burkholderiales bacterium]|nr:EAL domain-containing protein [Burkholderiales bacterium]